ncbi:MAG: anti-sigma factor domain-containing protein [Eubacteriales bacterium]|nr:anti-sigma factor domain-containing protein [Eubacteriales bacterium]
MNRKALILEIQHKTAVILTEDHEYLKIRLQPGYAVGQTIQVSPEDLFLAVREKGGVYMSKKWITVVASLVLVVAIGVLAVQFGQTPNHDAGTAVLSGNTSSTEAASQLESVTATAQIGNPAVAVLAIDINPSMELQLNADGLVVAWQAMNQDAEKLQFGELVGMPAEQAVEKIILAAQAAGFLDSDTETDDFVVLAMVPLVEQDDVTEPLFTRLQTRLHEQVRLQIDLENVNLVMVQATEQLRIQAHQEEIGLGLHVMNQKALQAHLDEAKTVREYFANQERRQLAEEAGYVWQSQYGGSEEGPGQGTQQQSRESTGNSNQGETSGSGNGAATDDTEEVAQAGAKGSGG